MIVSERQQQQQQEEVKLLKMHLTLTMIAGRKQTRWQKNHLGRLNPRRFMKGKRLRMNSTTPKHCHPYEGKKTNNRWAVQSLCGNDPSEHQCAFDGCDEDPHLRSLPQRHNQQQATTANHWSNQAHWGMQCSYTSPIAREEKGSRVPHYQMFDRGHKASTKPYVIWGPMSV